MQRECGSKQIRPDWQDAHISITSAYLEMRKPEQAQAHCDAMLRAHPASSSANVWMGHALNSQGRIQDAKAAYQRADEIDGKAGDPLGILAREAIAEIIPPDETAIASYLRRVNDTLNRLPANLRQP
jgi:hypothetical protein